MPSLMKLAVSVCAIFTSTAALAAPATINACYNKVNGIARVVSAGSACLPFEIAVSWNVQGPAGPQGPIGPAGATGPAGPQGPAGSTGAAGAIGPQGPIGPAGATGPAGPLGPTGLTGPAGVTGATGPQGPPVTFRGTWSSGTSYAIGDAVAESGNSYVALAASTAIDPATDVAGSGGHWAVLAAQG